MAGIYLHIPFCKQACHYCDFHFSTNLRPMNELINCMSTELELKAPNLANQAVTSIYFGGGTPSLLPVDQINLLLQKVYDLYHVKEDVEITMEANPDDLSVEKIRSLKDTPINRFSVGIQSFDDERLSWMNRSHSSTQAIQCLQHLKEVGFENITADLIYAIPPENMDLWKDDLHRMLEFDLPHLSLYGLTIEEKTVLGHRYKKGAIEPVSEEAAAQQYEYAIEYLTDTGYEHYEVSNFAKPGWHSRHNSSYWDDQHFLGIGPGAHGYNGSTRSYNVSNNAAYIKALKTSELPETVEQLSSVDQVNEMILTRLRTKKGLDLTALKNGFQIDLQKEHQQLIGQLIAEGRLQITQNQMKLTTKGFLLADEIALRLFYEV